MTVLFYPLNADRGLIPFNPNITVFEPNQRAVIAWNGEEEILLLATDLRASDSTMVLEVLPLPSEPKVKKGDIRTFQKAIEMINDKMKYRFAPGRKRNGSQYKPPAEITFHKRIGAHDISVAHLLKPEGFIEWVKRYLASLNYNGNIISEKTESIIEEYINEGFNWFVFDIITLKKETVTNEPIQYQFKTDALFYPLKITSLNSGNTTIELIILTPKLLQKFSGLPIEYIKLKHEPITITRDELKEIDEDMYTILKDYPEMKLRIWEIGGLMSSFDKDLFAR